MLQRKKTQKIYYALFFIILFCVKDLKAQDISDPPPETKPISHCLSQAIIPAITRPIMAFPFDVPMIWKQLTHKPYGDIFKDLKINDVKLKHGFASHFFILLIRGFYIYPTAAFFPKLFEYIKYPNFIKKHPFTYHEILAVTLASIDGTLSPIFERIKVNYIYHGRFSMWDSFAEYCRASKLTFQSSFLNLTVFFALNEYLSKTLQNRHPHSPLTIGEYVFMGGILGTVQSVLIYPFLTLRTKVQANSLLVDNVPVDIRCYLKRLYNTGKLGGLYRGIELRLARTFLMATFDSYWLNYIEHSASSPKNENKNTTNNIGE